jgi:hypothetical protein
VQALNAYSAGMMDDVKKQYTIRRVPDRVDQLLREKAAQYKISLNEAALEALTLGIGAETGGVEHHDLDDLAGTWVQDDTSDQALADMDRIDPELWK